MQIIIHTRGGVYDNRPNDGQSKVVRAAWSSNYILLLSLRSNTQRQLTTIRDCELLIGDNKLETPQQNIYLGRPHVRSKSACWSRLNEKFNPIIEYSIQHKVNAQWGGKKHQNTKLFGIQIFNKVVDTCYTIYTSDIYNLPKVWLEHMCDNLKTPSTPSLSTTMSTTQTPQSWQNASSYMIIKFFVQCAYTYLPGVL